MGGQFLCFLGCRGGQDGLNNLINKLMFTEISYSNYCMYFNNLLYIFQTCMYAIQQLLHNQLHVISQLLYVIQN